MDDNMTTALRLTRQGRVGEPTQLLLRERRTTWHGKAPSDPNSEGNGQRHATSPRTDGSAGFDHPEPFSKRSGGC